MNVTNQDLDRSWSLVLAACKLELGRADQAEALFEGTLPIGDLIQHGIFHRMLPMLAANILESGVKIRSQAARFFRTQLRHNLLRTQLAVEEAASISRMLAREGIKHAFRKGIILQGLLYRARGARQFNDTDLAIHPDDASRAAQILIENGYTPAAFYDYGSGKLLELTRKDLLIYKLSPDHLPYFTKVFPDHIASENQIDVALSISWSRSNAQMPMSRLLERTESLEVWPGISIPTYRLEILFIDVIMHLFREAYLDRFAVKSDRITKFLDVALFWTSFKNAFDREELNVFLADAAFSKAILWVAYHTDRVLSTSMLPELQDMFACTVLEEDFERFHSRRDSNGSIVRWDGDMMSRLRQQSMSL